MESIKKILFLCDGNVPECKKTHCYKSGGECKCTSDIRHAINLENVSEYGTYYKIGHDISDSTSTFNSLATLSIPDEKDTE